MLRVEVDGGKGTAAPDDQTTKSAAGHLGSLEWNELSNHVTLVVDASDPRKDGLRGVNSGECPVLQYKAVKPLELRRQTKLGRKRCLEAAHNIPAGIDSEN